MSPVSAFVIGSDSPCTVVLPAFAQTAPDNTQVNTRDRAKGAVTAEQQKANARDVDVAKRIRQSVVKDKSDGPARRARDSGPWSLYRRGADHGYAGRYRRRCAGHFVVRRDAWGATGCDGRPRDRTRTRM